MSDILHRIEMMDRALAAKGFPPLSEWWLETIASFYTSGARQCVIRAGRRAGKSSSLCRVAVAEGLYGAHRIPPGDVGVVAFISTSRDEASGRLRTIRAILDALGVRYRERGDSLELESRPVVFKTFVASVASVSGFTAIAAFGDEAAKWRDSETGANPATEVLASLRPTMATQPNARLFMSSSPWGSEDAHAKAFDAGDNEFQRTYFAPTWLANPTITEAETKALEPDPRVWAREYAALPQSAVGAAFDAEDVLAAFRPVPAGVVLARPVVSLDASSGRGDSCVWAALGWGFLPEPLPLRNGPSPLPPPAAAPPPLLVVRPIESRDGRFAEWLPFDALMRRVAEYAKRERASLIISDQRESYAIAAELAKHGRAYRELPWTNTSKGVAVERLRRLLRDRRIILPVGDDKLRKELIGFQEKVTPNGTLTWSAKGREHDDRVAVLLTAMLAETERLLSKWPANRPPEEQYAFLADFPDASGIDLSSTPDPARDFRTAGALIEFQQESKS